MRSISQSMDEAVEGISVDLIDKIRTLLSQGKRVRYTLPQDGRLHIDRPLPFLCVYRRPAMGPDPGTDQLVTGE
ncbi:MAG: flavohemoglobin expression-modulating QEGLA motif protein, partial [Anaerolineae bacterium]|nr:flavohemoglobin expression-modulating QEGLA motif protein [Anaerolineae bacterium]